MLIIPTLGYSIMAIICGVCTVTLEGNRDGGGIPKGRRGTVAKRGMICYDGYNGVGWRFMCFSGLNKGEKKNSSKGRLEEFSRLVVI